MRTQGFSLPELLTALAIAATLTFLVIPTINTFIDKQRLYSGLTSLSGSLRYARSHAAVNQVGVTVLANQASWSSGWQVFEDTNSNARIDEGERLLLNRRPHKALVIEGNQTVASYIHYDMTGEPQLTGGGFQAGTIQLCSLATPTAHYQLIVAKTGRIRVELESGKETCP